MPADRTPKSDAKTLYISGAYSSETFVNLTERAAAHFDLTRAEVMEQVDLNIEQIQVRGCLCHYDPSDYESYFVLTRNTPAQAMSNDAELLAEMTSGSYSAGNFPNGHWEKCAQELLDRGLTMNEAEAYLNSKHMRWCYDNAEVWNNATIIDFRKYLDSGRNMDGASLKQEALALLAGA